ncbi:beta-amyrin 28-oxidase-like protein [Cinnamomum micranthum f. kanehirae]|uniref:Beta-amyrin 28-oxidase-like protein n=1 Tax=Cinnamomum micranthum f. kanehirae TaxID=337451 RepID=A0A3S3MG34_9MAGN|nr:beta-amyrin 28-oxidase-like protein [Cinnamomum micranthum f. kanehirae]
MGVFLLSLFLIALSSFFALFLTYNKKKGVNTPPGSSGWPILGELLEFFGKPENFVRDRMEKYSSQIFKTSLLWEPMAVFCGPAGNKFLFSNENKLVQTWWPTSIQKIFTFSLITSVGDKAKLTRRLLMTYLKPEALQRYVGFVDAAANRHMQAEWECKGEVKAFHLIKLFTFYLACSLFTGIEDPDHLSKLIHEFNVLVHGLFGFPLNLPGMRLYRSMRAAEAIRKDLYFLIQQKRVALLEKAVSSPETQDLLSYLIVTTDEEGRFMTQREIVDNILVLLFAGHDTSSSTLALVLKYLAEMPHVYNEVLKEQLEIARSKAPGKLLDWGDLQKMRYTWNVVNEVMRLSPAVQGAFREAIADFKYAGYAVPKGWKLYWSVNTTHKDPEYFPEPEKFDPSRFEGEGPAPYTFNPFGGGPRMCPGKEFAKLQILVFLHNLVKRFRWEAICPNEKIEIDPMPSPVEGLPLRLHPHHS